MVEKDKVGRHLPQPGLHPGQGVPRDRRGLPHGAATPPPSASPPATPVLDFGVAQHRKQKVVDQLVGGLSGLLKKRKVTVVNGFGIARPRQHRGHRRRRHHPRRRRRRPGRRLGAPHAPRLRRRRHVRPHLRRGALVDRPARSGWPSSAAASSAASSPPPCPTSAAEVTILEFLPDADAAGRQGHPGGHRALVQEAGHRRSTPAPRSRATSPPAPAAPCVRWNGDADPRGRRHRHVGRPPPATPTACVGDGTGVEVDDRGFVKVDGTMRTSADGVWAVGDVVNTPQLAHVGFAEAIVAIKDILGEEAVPIDYDKVPVVHLLPPRGGLRRPHRGGGPEAGFDIVVEKLKMVGNGRAIIVGETDGHGEDRRREGPRRHGRPRPRRPHRRPLGHRAARPGLPGRQLGGHGRRDRRASSSPTPPFQNRSARPSWRSPGEACTADDATSRCPSSVRPSPRERSPAGSSRSATRSPRTRSSTRSRPTRSTPRCRRPPAATWPRSWCAEGETVDVGTVLAVISADARGGRRCRRARGRAGRARGRDARGRDARAGAAPAPEPAVARAAEDAGSARRRRRHRHRRSRGRPRPHRGATPRAPPATACSCRRSCAASSTEHGLDPAADHRHRRRRPHHPRRRPEGRSTAAAPRPRRAGGARRAPRRRPRPRRRPLPPSARPAPCPPPAAGERDTVIPFSRIRRVTAEHMVRSKATSRAHADRRRGRLHGRRAGPHRPEGGVQGRARASASPTCRSSPGPSSTPSPSSPT